MRQTIGFICAASAWACVTHASTLVPQERQDPGQKDKDRAREIQPAMPRCAQPLTTEIGDNAVQMFADAGFKGEHISRMDVIGKHEAGALNVCQDDLDDEIGSLRWNLEPGVLVILYEEADGTGDQLPLWGTGEITDLSKCDFDDEASGWSWYDFRDSSSRSEGLVQQPVGSQRLTGPISADSVELYDDQQFKAERQIIAHIGQQAAGTLHQLPGEGTIRDEKENAASSLRWKLPAGTIVILSANDDGSNCLVLFGEGEYADLGKCNFDNRASRWSWTRLTARGTDKPAKPDSNQDGMNSGRRDERKPQ
jgi:hypothetical protein